MSRQKESLPTETKIYPNIKMDMGHRNMKIEDKNIQGDTRDKDPKAF